MSQQMKLAPRMIQSMEILQMPYLDLQERIDQELAENEFLENGAADQSISAEMEGGRAGPDPKQEVERRELDAGGDDNGDSDFERLLEISADWPEDNYTSGSKASSNRIRRTMPTGPTILMANAASRPQTLQDSLLEQFHYFDCPPHIRAFGEYLFSEPRPQRLPAEFAAGDRAGLRCRTISMEDGAADASADSATRSARRRARDAKECLLLQLRPGHALPGRADDADHFHLEDIAQNRMPVIERKTGYSLEVIKDAIEELKKLDPWPGRRFESAPVAASRPT